MSEQITIGNCGRVPVELRKAGTNLVFMRIEPRGQVTLTPIVEIEAKSLGEEPVEIIKSSHWLPPNFWMATWARNGWAF